MRVLKGLLFLLLIMIHVQLNAQVLKSVTHEKEPFLEEMNTFLSASDKNGTKAFMETFEPFWLGSELSESQRESIYKFSDLMLKKRKKANDFSRYLFTIMSFSQSGQSDASFEAWHSNLSQVIEGTRKHFSSYLEVCEILFKNNLLYESRSVKWRATSKNYEFGFDSIPFIKFNEEFDLVGYSKDDSTVIHKTSGLYYPTEEKWVGQGGIIDWARAGFDPSSVNAELNDYSLDITRSEYSIPNVIFS